MRNLNLKRYFLNLYQSLNPKNLQTRDCSGSQILFTVRVRTLSKYQLDQDTLHNNSWIRICVYQVHYLEIHITAKKKLTLLEENEVLSMNNSSYVEFNDFKTIHTIYIWVKPTVFVWTV